VLPYNLPIGERIISATGPAKEPLALSPKRRVRRGLDEFPYFVRQNCESDLATVRLTFC
jgi:hypothetical protein